MKRLLLSFAVVSSLVLSAFSLSGCNTFHGMGADTKETINVLHDGPRDAYHQDARDF